MSAKAESSDAAPAGGGLTTKKLIVILAVAMGVMAVGIGATVMVLTKRAAAHAAAEADDDAGPGGHKKKKKEINQHPVFLPLDPFVVNLTDKEQDRYAQIGITLEIDDPQVGERMKIFMPAIRSGILITLAHKSSKELLTSEGKEQLAEEIMREAMRPLGVADGDDGPVRAVHFASFIIQ